MGQTVEIGMARELNIARPLRWEMQSERLEHRRWLEEILWITSLIQPLVGLIDLLLGALVGLALAIANKIAERYKLRKVPTTRSGSGHPPE